MSLEVNESVRAESELYVAGGNPLIVVVSCK